MQLNEVFIQGKYGDAARCEDGYVLTADFAAVVDGSTSKRAAHYRADAGNTASAAITGGRLAMETVTAALGQLEATADMPTAVAALTAALRAQWPAAAATDAAYRPTCSAAIYSRHRREVWLIGDCQCRHSGHTFTNPKAVDTILATIRGDIIRYLLHHGHSADSLRRRDLGRAFIYDALRDQTNFQNDSDRYNPYRYTVLDGAPVDTTCVKVIPLGPAPTLILATDGYPVVNDSLAATEAALAQLLRDDPLCIDALAATKGLMDDQCSFDDRTYLSLNI